MFIGSNISTGYGLFLYNKTFKLLHLFLNRSKLKSCHGLRLVELRTDPEGVVFHHWEFLSETPPTEFTLKSSRVKNLPPDAKQVIVFAEDNLGFNLKKRVNVADFVKS